MHRPPDNAHTGHRRRHILGAATLVAASALTTAGSAQSQSPAADRSLGALRQVRAGVLNVGYLEVGPATGWPVILLHGFPYDIHAYDEVAQIAEIDLMTEWFIPLALNRAATADHCRFPDPHVEGEHARSSLGSRHPPADPGENQPASISASCLT